MNEPLTNPGRRVDSKNSGILAFTIAALVRMTYLKCSAECGGVSNPRLWFVECKDIPQFEVIILRCGCA